MSMERNNTSKKTAVGYGSPPVEHRFKKGQSGNPAGRPKKIKLPDRSGGLPGALEPLKEWLLEEAYRPVSVREGEEVVKLPAIKAMIRSMHLAALKGDRVAQKLVLKLVQDIEREQRDLQIEMFKIALSYKHHAQERVEYCKRNNLEDPELYPHPDDIEIDMRTGATEIRGAMNRDEHENLSEIEKERDRYIEELGQLRRTPEISKRRNDVLTTLLNRAIERWNAALPPRLQRTVDDVYDARGCRLEGGDLRARRER